VTRGSVLQVLRRLAATIVGKAHLLPWSPLRFLAGPHICTAVFKVEFIISKLHANVKARSRKSRASICCEISSFQIHPPQPCAKNPCRLAQATRKGPDSVKGLCQVEELGRVRRIERLGYRSSH
jgi:hypothetical protein